MLLKRERRKPKQRPSESSTWLLAHDARIIGYNLRPGCERLGDATSRYDWIQRINRRRSDQSPTNLPFYTRFDDWTVDSSHKELSDARARTAAPAEAAGPAAARERQPAAPDQAGYSRRRPQLMGNDGKNGEKPKPGTDAAGSDKKPDQPNPN